MTSRNPADDLNARIAIGGVSERDIDLLLLEEFRSSVPSMGVGDGLSSGSERKRL